jgi:hypothetical protein
MIPHAIATPCALLSTSLLQRDGADRTAAPGGHGMVVDVRRSCSGGGNTSEALIGLEANNGSCHCGLLLA